ncbi:MAG TPA: hypothetical protein ENN55_02140 [Firmicutes bacterium]|nr:hypothetical protein [Bacillota bacterium]
MAAWFHRPKYTIIRKAEKQDTKIPEGMWLKCEKCDSILLKKELEENLNVCGNCGDHKRITAGERIRILVDEGSFEKMFGNAV